MKEKIINILKPIWVSGNKRHQLSLGLTSYLRKNNFKKEDVKDIISKLSDLSDDSKKFNRLVNVETQYARDINSLAGYSRLNKLVPSMVLNELEKVVRFDFRKFNIEELKIKSSESIGDYMFDYILKSVFHKLKLRPRTLQSILEIIPYNLFILLKKNNIIFEILPNYFSLTKEFRNEIISGKREFILNINYE